MLSALGSQLARLFWGHYPINETFLHCAQSELPFISIDLELTSLETETAKITSIGWVKGKMNEVDLATAEYDVVRASGDLFQSPVIHGLCAKEIASGSHIREKIEALREYADSHIWVFHNAALDMSVLQRVSKLLGYEPLIISTIDTMLLQVYIMEKAHGFVPGGSVTLSNARAHYNLIEAPEHNALDDAVATLSLLFAQFHELDKKGVASLRDLAHTRAIRTYQL
ncbi:3'-5' exonuclease [Glaciecola petra]|uniref:3'-5' exonuclease n=1 Tax=Glaciecola petra TaxID=3075602 RepID=A0ABU2ZXT7_9ALTE|nr:3'-5' exonuclease [Aestuariibacter sp. P117]MDT0596212.1 3'-5' exonuclease [Aestuariibacter sp. P117]